MDVMFIQGLPVLTGIDDIFKFRTAIWMPDRSFKEFYIAVDKITRTYNSKGYRISRVDYDREFKPMMDPVNDDMDLKMFYPPLGGPCTAS